MGERDGVERGRLNSDGDKAGEGLGLRFLGFVAERKGRFRGGSNKVMCCTHGREL